MIRQVYHRSIVVRILQSLILKHIKAEWRISERLLRILSMSLADGKNREKDYIFGAKQREAVKHSLPAALQDP